MNIREKFDEAIDELYESHQYLAAEITKLGYPELVNYVPTAGIMWDKKLKKIKFIFNKKFAEKLNKREFNFVVAHETLHFINMHIFLFKKKMNELKERRKENSEINRIMQKLNIAADCVVNDSLVSLYKFDKHDKLGGKDIYYGQKTINMGCHDMTVMDVFYLLPENITNNSFDEHFWKSFCNEDGSFNKDFIDAVKDFIEENSENSAISDEEAFQVDSMKEAMENSSDSYASKAGHGVGGKLRPIDGLGKNALNWNKILYQFVDSNKICDVWNRPHRKMISVYPDVIIPSDKPQKTEEIFVAIDTSGSINQQACTLFLDVVKNTPKRLNIKAITFDTSCYEYDVRGNKQPQGGGGTCFSIIEEYIQNNFKKYPKAVFVLTDGEGTNVNPKWPSRWCWLLYGSCRESCLGKMKRYKILDLLK